MLLAQKEEEKEDEAISYLVLEYLIERDCHTRKAKKIVLLA